MIRFFTALLLLFILTDRSNERFYTQDGSFLYSNGGVRNAMDITPDGRIAISLKNDVAFVHYASLTTFDPTTGTQLDNKIFGFGPLEVKAKQISNAERVVVMTSEGGPRTIYLFDLDSAGKLTLLATTRLTESNTDAQSNLFLSDIAPVGFTMVSPGAGLGAKNLIAFSLVDGSIINRATVPTALFSDNRMGTFEAPGKRLLAYFIDFNRVEVFNALDPLHPVDLGSITLPATGPSSGNIPSIEFTSDGQFAIISDPFSSLDFVNLDTMQVAKSIQGGRAYGRIRVYESDGHRTLAILCSAGGHGFVLQVDATDPNNPAVVNQLDIDNIKDLTFSRDGTRLFLLGAKVQAFALPAFKPVWSQISVIPSPVNIQQIMIYGDSERLLAGWTIHPGLNIISMFGSFPYQPQARRGQLTSE
jgi:hypothetical protein